MTEIFQVLAALVASWLGVSDELGGIVLGLAVLVVIFVGFLVLYAVLEMQPSPFALAVPLIIGLAVVGMTGWFPPWAMLFIIILAAAAFGNRLMSGGSD